MVMKILLYFEKNNDYINGDMREVWKIVTPAMALREDDTGQYYVLQNKFWTHPDVETCFETLPQGQFYYPLLLAMHAQWSRLDLITIPDNVVTAVQQGQAKILMINTMEGWETRYWSLAVEDLKNRYGLIDDNFVLITGNYGMSNKYQHVYMNYWELSTYHDHERYFKRLHLKLSHIKPKKFLCMNNRADWHRTLTVSHLLPYADQGILTYNQIPNSEWQPDYIRSTYPEYQERVSRLMSSMPLIYKDNNTSTNIVTDHDIQKFLDTNFQIVTETFYSNNFEDVLFFSEKTYKPVVFLQPFILIAQHYSLKTFRSFGYKTFDGFIDESYDDEIDCVSRFRKIAGEIDKLLGMSNAQLSRLVYDNIDILMHNVEHLEKRSNHIVISEVVENLKKFLH
jgi:hypothetical protein